MKLRDKKKARTKLGILNATLTLMKKRSFQDILVEEICEIVEISRVTFFKYFPKKEDIFYYYFIVWCFHRTIELDNPPKKGWEAIIHLFNITGQELNEIPNLNNNLLKTILNLKGPPMKFDLSIEERKLLYPAKENLEAINIFPLRQMLRIFIQQAFDSGHINPIYNTDTATNLVISTFYGTSMTALLNKSSDPHFIYQDNLRIIMECLAPKYRKNHE